ncbi:hypothetical protein ABEB36_006243 [Hypothenemus hampei]|uniref:THAP-type domain-containing protein n=2 Tax=Hypothenemus hampei TaxID=57062 RepID=A0ABD1EQH2_HYPHA
MNAKRKVGGFTCAANKCKNNTAINRNISFFRFPSNPQRANQWAEVCGINNVTPEKLYKNYRVCAKHFAPDMFLNDLQNRLQPHAKPIIINEIDEEVESAFQSKVNDEILMDTIISVDFTLTSTDTSASSALNSSDINMSKENNENINLKNNVGVQTELQLSNSTPRKRKLRMKCEAAEKRATRAELKVQEEKQSLDRITYNDFQKLLYKFFPKPMADFIKIQGDNLQKSV